MNTRYLHFASEMEQIAGVDTVSSLLQAAPSLLSAGMQLSIIHSDGTVGGGGAGSGLDPSVAGKLLAEAACDAALHG